MLHNDLTKEVIMLRATMADMRKSVDFFQTDEVINIIDVNYLYYISDVTLYYQNAAARVIHMDNGATNGIVHIIDSFLFAQSDLTLHVVFNLAHYYYCLLYYWLIF
jgi:uncharacterized surface protein with fasciclin (FAS1) repeats